MQACLTHLVFDVPVGSIDLPEVGVSGLEHFVLGPGIGFVHIELGKGAVEHVDLIRPVLELGLDVRQALPDEGGRQNRREG